MWQFNAIPTVLYANVRKAIAENNVRYLRDITIRYGVRNGAKCNCGSDTDLLHSYKTANEDGKFTVQIHSTTT